MTDRPRRLLLAIAVVAASPAMARAETFQATYSLSIIGLSIGNAYAKATLDPTSYKIDIGVKLSGVAALVSSARGAATASGVIAGTDVLPAAYANTTANSQETRTVRMGLDAGTVRAVDIQPPFPDVEDRIPITDAMKQRILDPVSALLMRVPDDQSLIGPSACNRTLPVYDGLVRYNVALSYVSIREVQTRGYSGPVTVCSARYVPVAGYKRDSSSTRYMANNRDIEVWLAPVVRAHVVVPFHISIRTSAGILLIQAADFHPN
jgi:hypothetical protein